MQTPGNHKIELIHVSVTNQTTTEQEDDEQPYRRYPW